MELPITDYRTSPVGHLEFAHDHLSATRAIDGLVLVIPCKLSLRERITEDANVRPVVLNLTIEVSYENERVGFITLNEVHHEAKNSVLATRLFIPTATVREIERRRGDKPMQFKFGVRWTVAHREGDREAGLTAVSSSYNTTEATYPVLSWSGALRSAGLAENVYVEVRLAPLEESSEFDAAVATHLREAKDALARGGRDGTTKALNHARMAFEAWAALRKKTDPNGKPHDFGTATLALPPMGPARDAWTRQQRLDLARHVIHQLAHQEFHHAAESLSRPDATLIVAALAGLVGAEKG